MKPASAQLSVVEKIGYGLGDAASHIVLDNVVTYLPFFYTDVLGIPAGFAGTMFLLARGLDAVSDPIMGFVADRTRTRWGKFRPYLLWGAVPFAVLCVLTYSSPQTSLTNKMIFAAVTQTLLTLAYTFVNIPYCAMSGVITADPPSRMSLQSYRFALATAGGMLSTVLMVPLVHFVDATNIARGYQGAIAILAVIAAVMLLICFATTRERLAPESSGKARLLGDLLDVARNDQWRIIGLLTFCNITGFVVRAGAMIFYVTYLLGDQGRFAWFLGTYSAGNILGSALAKPLSDRFCKVSLYGWLNGILGVLSVAMYLIPAGSVTTMFALIFVIGVLHQAATPIQWVMMSDTVDYGEWKQGRRLTGVNFAGTLFVLKLGLALAGAIIGWTLQGVAYQKGAAVQSANATRAILILFTLAPAVFYFLSAWITRFYSLRKDTLAVVLGDLAARRAAPG
ncbi:MAG TPA: glycoside-pentoside-hexuronide (GPH):cation symporter [Candidatus Didemnitutus sp.]|nr:glycoside-pentoside-hexuronide (GPH):cation symporter [Candidatus Didemnitutus sp.]